MHLGHVFVQHDLPSSLTFLHTGQSPAEKEGERVSEWQTHAKTCVDTHTDTRTSPCTTALYVHNIM